MSDVFVGLEEAAVFEGVVYDTMKKRVQRSPQQYKTKTQPREGGGKDQVLISVASLSPKGRKAWKAAQKVDGRDVIIDKRTEAAPWYVEADLNYYIENNKKAYYEAVELAARVQDEEGGQPSEAVGMIDLTIKATRSPKVIALPQDKEYRAEVKGRSKKKDAAGEEFLAGKADSALARLRAINE